MIALENVFIKTSSSMVIESQRVIGQQAFTQW